MRWLEPPVLLSGRLRVHEAAELHLLENDEEMDKMDKMFEVNVPTSTSQVELHTARWFASVSV